MLKFLSKLINGVLNIFGQTMFKAILSPGYRFFLFIKKYFNQYLLYNPLLPLDYNKTAWKSGVWLHAVVGGLFILALVNNFLTRNIYAEEFGRNSIMAELYTDELDVEIVEYSLPIEPIAVKPKTESIMDAIGAVETKAIITGKTVLKNNLMALSQGGEAVIRPVITPFREEKKAEIGQESTAARTKEIQNYIVQAGDTLSAIAEKFGISINTILWENDLSLSSYIRPGDKLTILPVTGVSYTVKSGDTLSKIAAGFGTDMEKIIAFNGLDRISVLKVRQKIIIPDGKLGYTNLTPSRSVGSIKNILTPSAGAASDNNFLWPSISKRITQYYHWRHHAVDIGAGAGTPIYAARAGRVERAGWNTGYGYNLVIDHGGGVKTLYAHSRKLYAQRGDQVEQGEVIGEVGSTGWSTGPHIHFEIIVNGAKVNPLSYL